MSRRPTGGPLFERLLRAVLAFAMPRPRLFRLALIAARLAAAVFEAVVAALGLERGRGPAGAGSQSTDARAEKLRRARHLSGRKARSAAAWRCSWAACRACIDPSINAATIRLLTRLGYEVVVTGGETCCGSLTHHMGKEADAIWRGRGAM